MPFIDPMLLSAMEWRCIGPHRGGRVVAVAGDPNSPMVFYFGACAGGLWKTEDGGTYWYNVSDGFFKTAAVGAVAIADSDPNVIYVGMGESCIRGDVSHGDGVHRSADGGKSWANTGLEQTRHISRVRIHPDNPDVVYVAALGHAFGPNKERGIYRTQNGGKTWDQVLFKSEKAGAIDLSMDSNNPRILYAAIYETQRYPWALVSGGPDSGLHMSSDGGDTWTDLTDNPGLPKGLIGRIGVAASPAKPGRVWAMIEAEEGGLYRSDNGGTTWERVSDDAALRGRPWYYTHVFADPQDADTVYILEGQAHRSTDGGRTFTQMPTPHGDNHDLWIDPRNPQRMIEGNDGGACVSFNGGATWSSIYNQPTAQFYHVITDTTIPYRVYGSQQDNSSISVPSRSHQGAITQADWQVVGGGESGYIAVRPDDPDIAYAGNHSNGYVTRYNRRTGQARNVMVWPEPAAAWGARDMKYRFQWTFPIVLSPHDPNLLYVAGNHLFRSTNGGSSWEAISPDLTRNDDSKLGPSGGPISQDGTNTEYYCTIFAFAESAHEPGVLWAGSDDGLLHISKDSGKTWENITPKDLPEWALFSIIDLSPHDLATAYVAATRYKLDDTRPYLYKTNDYGKTWVKITNGIPKDDFTRVIREDPGRRGLLYAGTETGIYVSFDDGGNWQPLQLNLPVAPIHDLTIKDTDLIAATHGRSFWILDDLTPLHQITEQVAESSVHLFQPGRAYRYLARERSRAGTSSSKTYAMAGPLLVTYYHRQGSDGEPVRTYLDAGQNPPSGVMVFYYLKGKPQGEVTLTFSDEQGEVIRTFRSKAEDESSAASKGQEQPVPVKAGMNRFAWNMRLPDATRVPGDVPTEQIFEGSLNGPVVLPGTYRVELNVEGRSYEQTFEIRADPRIAVAQEDMKAQFDFLLRIRDKLSATHGAINQIRSIRQQVDEWVGRTEGQSTSDPLSQNASAIKEKLKAIEGELTQVRARAQIDRLKFPVKLNGKLAGLVATVASADERPAEQTYAVFDHVSEQVDAQLQLLGEVIESDLSIFTNLISELQVPAVVPRSTP